MTIVTDKPVDELTKAISSRADLVAFIRQLRCDLRDDPATWENVTLDSYMEAMAAWTEDSDGYYQNAGLPIPKTTSWQTLADILLAAKSYE